MSMVSEFTIEVKPSHNYQSVSFSTTLTWATPVTLDEANFEADVAYAELQEIALKRVNELAAIRGSEQPQAHGPIQQSGSMPGVNPADDSTWPTAYKPNGAGSFKYLPTSVVPRQRFIEMVEAKLPELGIKPDDVVIYDDRGGDRGIENNGHSYTAGKVKVKTESPLAAAMQGKTILANVDFVPGGDVHVSLSRDGKTAMQAAKIASQFASMGAVEETSTPF